MISFDLECSNGHRFEGIFRDYKSYKKQLSDEIIACPLCNTIQVKRLYTGCSIQSKSSNAISLKDENKNIFEMIKIIEKYVKNNFEYVGNDFAEKSRAIYYGIEEEKNIYGESSRDEINELIDEGISILPLPNLEKLEN